MCNLPAQHQGPQRQFQPPQADYLITTQEVESDRLAADQQNREKLHHSAQLEPQRLKAVQLLHPA